MAETTETYRETVREGSRRGVEYEIVRTDAPQWTRGTGFENEFVLYVEGASVTTASNLETRGYTNPWIPALETYVAAYIDGFSDAGRGSQPNRGGTK